jgi:hypothetical protein
MKHTRAELAAELEAWGDVVDPEVLVVKDSTVLQRVSRLASEREAVELDLFDAVHAARETGRTWSEIGAMLGVSKQAAQRKFGNSVRAA